MTRNNLSEDEAMRKISAQIPIGVKLRKADIAIDNSGTIAQLEKKISSKIV